MSDYYKKLFFFNYDQVETVRQWLHDKHGAKHPVNGENFLSWNPFWSDKSLCHWFMNHEDECYYGQEYAEEDIIDAMDDYIAENPNAEIFRIDLDPGILEKNYTPPPPPPPTTIEEVFKF